MSILGQPAMVCNNTCSNGPPKVMWSSFNNYLRKMKLRELRMILLALCFPRALLRCQNRLRSRSIFRFREMRKDMAWKIYLIWSMWMQFYITVRQTDCIPCGTTKSTINKPLSHGVAVGLGKLNHGIAPGVYLYARKMAFAGKSKPTCSSSGALSSL